MKQPRIFIGFHEVAGYFSRLRDGFRALGCRCDFVALGADWRDYGSSDSPHPAFRWLSNIEHRRPSGPFAPAVRKLLTICQLALRVYLLIWAAARYDIFIFSWNSSFLSRPRFCRHADLTWLRRLNRPTIAVYLGSDSRPGYISRSLQLMVSNRSTPNLVEAVAQQKRVLGDVERGASFVVNFPSIAHLLTRPFCNILALGTPCSLPDFPLPARGDSGTGGLVRIVHAPSSPIVKATSRIRACIELLEKEGLPIEYVEIINKNNTEVLKALASCDFVLDQCYSDFPLPILATEAAYYGKPSVICGYYATQIGDDIPADIIPPSCFCHPDDLIASVRKMIVDSGYRVALGDAARAFVRERWRPDRVAERYLKLASGNPEEPWISSPAHIRYLHGVGLTEDDARQVVHQFLAQGGRAALQLTDKPDLEQAFVDFARSRAH